MTNKQHNAVQHCSARPPYIASQSIRLLTETDPWRFLGGERFRHPGLQSRETHEESWVEINREDIVSDSMTIPGGRQFLLRRLLVTAAAGVGKSAFLQWLQVAINRHEGPAVAFLINFADLRFVKGELNIVQVLGNQLRNITMLAPNDFSPRQASEAIERLKRESNLVVLLDGLDQVALSHGDISALRNTFASPEWRSVRVVVSARPYAIQAYWHDLFQDSEVAWQFVRIEEFDEQQTRAFLGSDSYDRQRLDFMPEEMRHALTTPRILQYLRSLAFDDLTQLRTTADVYWRAINHLLREGMRNSAITRRFGLTPDEPTPSNVQARSLRQMLELLGAIAFQMLSTFDVRRDPVTGQEKLAPHFGRIHRSEFSRFREQLLARLSLTTDAERAHLDRDLDALAALNDVVAQGILDSVEGLQEISWRHRSLQEFFAAYWIVNQSCDADVVQLAECLYAPGFAFREEYYWFWRFVCEMPVEAFDPDAWTRAISLVFQPGDGTPEGTIRSCEMIYRAWPTLHALAEAGHPRAVDVRFRFLNEFESEILSGNRGEELRRVAEQFVGDFREVPSGCFRMGAPSDELGLPNTARLAIEQLVHQEGDPVELATRYLSHFRFPPGRAGAQARQQALEWWTEVFRKRDVQAAIRHMSPENESTVHEQQVDAFVMCRSPVRNSWYRLFDPGHGLRPSKDYDYRSYERVSPDADSPTVLVTWYEGWAFCLWAKWENKSCRLPEESEWEYAARAGAPRTMRYWWGEAFDATKANADLAAGRTVPPDMSRTNPWGFSDMLGNVWEWSATLGSEPSASPREGLFRVLRGGAWDSHPIHVQITARNFLLPAFANAMTGFRVARSLQAT
jgi:formylglycine-generating enzyme required for sulfatase activity